MLKYVIIIKTFLKRASMRALLCSMLHLVIKLQSRCACLKFSCVSG